LEPFYLGITAVSSVVIIKSLLNNSNAKKKQLWVIKFFLLACTNDMFNLTLQAFDQEKEQGGLYCI